MSLEQSPISTVISGHSGEVFIFPFRQFHGAHHLRSTDLSGATAILGVEHSADAGSHQMLLNESTKVRHLPIPSFPMTALTPSSVETSVAEQERLACSTREAADLFGVNYFSGYRLIQRRKLRICPAVRGQLLVALIGEAGGAQR